jgi:hypothetical protein
MQPDRKKFTDITEVLAACIIRLMSGFESPDAAKSDLPVQIY